MEAAGIPSPTSDRLVKERQELLVVVENVVLERANLLHFLRNSLRLLLFRHGADAVAIARKGGMGQRKREMRAKRESRTWIGPVVCSEIR